MSALGVGLRPHGGQALAPRTGLRRSHATTAAKITSDAVAATVAVALGEWWTSSRCSPTDWAWVAVLFVPLLVALIARGPIYRTTIRRRFVDDVAPIETSVALAALTTLGTLTLIGRVDHPEQTVPAVWVCAAILLPAVRMVRGLLARSLAMAPTLIVGNGTVAYRLCRRLESSRQYGLTPVGFLSLDPLMWLESGDAPVPAVPRLGPPEAISEVIDQTGAQAVIIAFSRAQDEFLLNRVLRVAQERRLRVFVVPRMFDAVGQRAHIEHVGGTPLVAMRRADPRGWTFTVKHVFDRIVAGGLLLLLAPLLVLIAGLVRFSSPGPILYRQRRVGRDDQPFDCLKFRSMRMLDEADAAPSFALDPDSAPGGVEGTDRRTRVGRVLRATSLDELPQLFNVVRGEMSMVGPRPERPDFVEKFDSQVLRYGERRRVKAGLTGWAQVHGLRGQTSIADRAEWDNYYIENWSLGLDFKILALTVPAMLRRAV